MTPNATKRATVVKYAVGFPLGPGLGVRLCTWLGYSVRVTRGELVRMVLGALGLGLQVGLREFQDPIPRALEPVPLLGFLPPPSPRADIIPGMVVIISHVYKI